MTQLDQFLARAETLLSRLEALLPAAHATPDWNAATAFRWRKSGAKDGRGYLQPVAHRSPIQLSDLHNIALQKQQIEQNTRQFVEGKPANNVLLTGARGTGKSYYVDLAAIVATGARAACVATGGKIDPGETPTEAALREFARVTRPGGRLVVCEFSTPVNPAFRKVYLSYLMGSLPAVARSVSSNPDAYVYLAESIRAWPDQPALAERMAATGWGAVAWRNLTGGIVALHRATRR